MNVKYFDNYKLQIEIIDNEHYQLLSICSKIIKTIENKELSLVLLKNITI